MTITTTTSMKESKAPVCSRCGYESRLMVLDPNGKPHCFDGCFGTRAPEPEGDLIASDPMDPKPGTSAKALEYLQGRGVFLSRSSHRVVAEDGQVVGVKEARRVMRPMAELEKERLKVEAYRAGQLLKKTTNLEPLADPDVVASKPLRRGVEHETTDAE